jgi:hypothetical protein
MSSGNKPQLKVSQRLIAGSAVILCVAAGAALLMHSRAATPFITSEVENGTMSTPATTVNDSTASGGRAVSFSAGSTSSGPVNGLLTTDPNFFPIAVFDQTLASNGGNYKAIGINTFVGLYNGYSTAEINAANANGLFAVGDQDSIGLNSSLSSKVIPAWLDYDEPDNAQPNSSGGYDPCITNAVIQQKYDNYKATDPLKRPVMIGFGRGVADVNWNGRGTCTGNTQYYKTAATAADIFAFDIYPVNNDGPSKLYLVAQGVDNLRSWVGNKPVWADIETTAFSQGNGTPTPAQTKFEVWSAIIHGAKGIDYFAHIFTPTFHEDGLLTLPAMKTAVTAINTQIASLAAVINVGTPVGNTVTSSAGTTVPVDTMTKNYQGSTYIFAAAMRGAATSATFKPTGVTSGTVTVVGESRTLTLSNGSFSDNYAGFDAHIYKIN